MLLPRSIVLVSLLAGAAPAAAFQLTVTSVEPAQNALAVPVGADVVVHFDRPVEPTSLPPFTDDLGVFGDRSGAIAGSVTLENNDQTVRFTPAAPFQAGEQVSVVLSHDVQAQDASFLRAAGWAFSFSTKTEPGSHVYEEIQVHTTDVLPSDFTRIYGGQACDLDEDGSTDLAIVSENSSDIRVFLSRDDQTGMFDDFLQPPNSTGNVPSPNLSADFNGDGHVDMVTANTAGLSVSVLFGNGDGTFQPHQVHFVGSGPHGIAVLDANGDGHPDIATANTGAGQIALLLNDGSGGFGAVTSFEGGGSGEYALSSADMNNDGIMDLVAGMRFSNQVRVHLGNGDGTFNMMPAQVGGGGPWMIVTGDVSGDGNVDVTIASGSASVGTILLGDGAGGLGAPTTYPMPGHMTATDVGDLDGDGDLDWILSSFGGGQWRELENDGTGTFTPVQTFFATSNPACAIILDIDNDRDLDLCLLDEIADEIRIFENVAPAEVSCFGDGSSGACPCGNPGFDGRGCANSTGVGGLLDHLGSGSTAADDLALVVSDVPSNQFGLVFMGPMTAPSIPFGDGLRCVSGQLWRFPARSTGTTGTFTEGPGVVAHTHANFPQSAQILAGQSWSWQGWYRDPSGPCGATSNATNALTVTFTP